MLFWNGVVVMSLDFLFRPRSIAVIGASRTAGSVGSILFQNLLVSGFNGPVYPVHPTASHIGSVAAYPSVSAITGEVDLAVIVVPSRHVLQAARSCGEKGVKALIVISAGFGELQGEGKRREAELLTIVRHYGMRMVGPNCLGIINTDPNVALNATFAPTWPPRGQVAFSSQSGALGVAIIDKATELGIGISQFVSVGNKADITGNDLLEYWENASDTQVVLLYLESFGDSKRFSDISRRMSPNKPIVAVKSGRTAAGARAATSHTGSLAGAERAVEALVQHTGMIRVDTVEELFDTAMLLANQPLPGGARIGIVTNAGGPGILATDACVSQGLEVPTLSAATQSALASLLPPEASVTNPVDMIAAAGPDTIAACLRLVLQDPNIDAAIALYVPPGLADTERVAKNIVQVSDEFESKPVLSCFMGAHGVPEALRSLKLGHVPSYAFPEAGARALARVVRYARFREEVKSPIARPDRASSIDAPRAAAAFEATPAGEWLSPDAVAVVLKAYGIPQAPTMTAHTASQAAQYANQLGFPVVCKALAQNLVHKTDERGVMLGLRSTADVEAVVDDFSARFGSRLTGVSIQQMVHSDIEVLVGTTVDPEVGTMVVLGLGGILVELLNDVVVRLHPLTEWDVAEMPKNLRGAKLFSGYRGSPPGDMEALSDVLRRINQLVADQPLCGELDLNPIKVLPPGKGVVVVDARIRRHTGKSAPLDG